MVPWDPMGHPTSCPRPRTGGMFHGIPRYHGTIGRDGQEGPSKYIPDLGLVGGTRDWWDVPWDPKAPWDNGTSRSPSGHSTAKLDNYGRNTSCIVVCDH